MYILIDKIHNEVISVKIPPILTDFLEIVGFDLKPPVQEYIDQIQPRNFPNFQTAILIPIDT